MMRYAYLRISAEDVPLNVQGGQPLPVPGGGRVVAVIPDFEGETELLVEVAVPADPVPGVHDPDRPVPPDSQPAARLPGDAAARAWGVWRASSAMVAWGHLAPELRERWAAALAEAGTRQDEPDAPLLSLVTTLDDLMQRWLREADVPGSGFELRVLRQRHARELAELIEPHARMLAQ